MEEIPEDLKSTKQVAIILGVCDETVRRYIREGKLKASKIGNYRIKPSDLAAFVASGNLERVGSNA
jgi:excisionase family DNA binding protein